MDELQGIVVALGAIILGLWGLEWVYQHDAKRAAPPPPPITPPPPAG